MRDFVIIPDSTCDFNTELMQKYNIPEMKMGLVTFPDGHTIEADNDWKDISPEEFYGMMKDKNSDFQSSTPIFEKVVNIYKKYLSQGIDVISICLSGAMSGSYNESLLASKEALEEYPDGKIAIIDSIRYSTAEGLYVALAAQQKKAGKSFEEVVQWLTDNKYRIHQIGPMDDLFYLAKKGRISNFKAFFGTMAGVNPMADFNRQGFSEVLAKCKGKAMAFDVALEYMKKTIENPQDQTIFVAHSARKQFAEKFAEMIQKELNPKEIYISNVGMGCGVNIGPGLCAAYYYGTELSENLENEKAIMREILDSYKAK